MAAGKICPFPATKRAQRYWRARGKPIVGRAETGIMGRIPLGLFGYAKSSGGMAAEAGFSLFLQGTRSGFSDRRRSCTRLSWGHAWNSSRTRGRIKLTKVHVWSQLLFTVKMAIGGLG